MNHISIRKMTLAVGLLAVVGAGVWAQPAAAPNATHGRFGYAARLEKEVGLTPEQRDGVRGLLAEQRQKSQAIREETDARIRALLNIEQQKKFDAFKAQNKAKQLKRGNAN